MSYTNIRNPNLRPLKNRSKKPADVFRAADLFWRNFVKTSFPNEGKGAHPRHLIEMRKAFISGFYSCLNEMLLKVDTLEDEDQMVEALELWRQDTDKSFKEICES